MPDGWQVRTRQLHGSWSTSQTRALMCPWRFSSSRLYSSAQPAASPQPLPALLAFCAVKSVWPLLLTSETSSAVPMRIALQHIQQSSIGISEAFSLHGMILSQHSTVDETHCWAEDCMFTWHSASCQCAIMIGSLHVGFPSRATILYA